MMAMVPEGEDWRELAERAHPRAGVGPRPRLVAPPASCTGNKAAAGWAGRRAGIIAALPPHRRGATHQDTLIAAAASVPAQYYQQAPRARIHLLCARPGAANLRGMKC